MLGLTKISRKTALLTVALTLAACGSGAGDSAKGGRGGPTKVGYMVASITTVPLPTQLGGRVVAYETSEVRPQVNGLVRARYFQEGSVVRKGQPLYRIDPSLYEAAVNQAQANVTSAQATAEAARVKANRYRPLAEMEAVSKQDYTDAAGAGAPGAGRRRPEPRRAQDRADQPALHQHSRADQRPDRTVACSPSARWSAPTRPIRWR